LSIIDLPENLDSLILNGSFNKNCVIVLSGVGKAKRSSIAF